MEGFEAPIHRALTQKIMIGGVPREMAILNGTLSAALFLGLQSPWGLPLGVGIHVLSALLATEDPQFFDVLRRYLRYKRFYES